MKLNQTLQIVECVLWQEEWEKEGENKNTKWENRRDRYGCMVLNIQKNIYESQEEIVNLSSPMTYQ